MSAGAGRRYRKPRLMLLTPYREAVARGELRPDAAQENAVRRLDQLTQALAERRGFSLFAKKPQPLFSFGRRPPPGGLYIWGDVGRGKTLLMDFFFEEAVVAKKRRAHFNRFMVDVHVRIHAERQRAGSSDPI